MKKLIALLVCLTAGASCSESKGGSETPPPPGRYDSYKGLVMAGYQGWFNAPDDGAGRNWHHYESQGSFLPGRCTIDFWPDVSEYEKTYPTSFVLKDGSTARTFSSYDASTVKTHFRWMQEYGLDGVFLQRFIAEISNPSGKEHFNRVLQSAVEASTLYERAVCVMYDLSGMPANGASILLNDAEELMNRYRFKERRLAPDYLFHNGKPLIVVWGVGFDDKRRYGLREANEIIDGLKSMGYSVMIGVPTYWRTFGNDTVDEQELHDVIRKCDILMPWFVGRYNENGYARFHELIAADISWCKQAGIDYAPLCFPGFSWRNMNPGSTPIDRNKGSFFWSQLSYCLSAGAGMLYIAMFDEIDEGTAIFKCANVKDVPENGEIPFQGIDNDLPTDHYLWLAGQAARMLHKEIPLSTQMPVR